MPIKELSTASQAEELTPPVVVPSGNTGNNLHQQEVIATPSNNAELLHPSAQPLEQAEPTRELTQTDRLNKHLLKSFLAHINATGHVMEHFAAHVPNATPPGTVTDDFEEQLFFGTQIM